MGQRRFEFDLDTFTFANELVWRYSFDPVTGAMRFAPNDPPPTYSHRCFVMVRAARQFFFHARFDPQLSQVSDEAYRGIIRQIVKRNPRRACPEDQRVIVPGYPCLRVLSQARAPLLKAEIGSPWESYFVRSHWRMVFPVHRWQQSGMARRLQRLVLEGAAPTVHLFRFPRITINHGIVLYALAESNGELRFTAYDPNIPANPVTLGYDKAARQFTFPPAIYWGGGPLNVIEIFRGGLY